VNYRKEIIDKLVSYFDKDEKLILLVGDCGFASIDELAKKHPQRVVNMGIAEQAMVGIAAGMAMAGMKPIVYTIVNFLCYRALEQIRNDIVLQNLPVKFIGTGADNYFNFLGKSHTCGEDDIEIMNLIGMPVNMPDSPAPITFDEWIERFMEEGKYSYIRV
jgi:transketolase